MADKASQTTPSLSFDSPPSSLQICVDIPTQQSIVALLDEVDISVLLTTFDKGINIVFPNSLTQGEHQLQLLTKGSDGEKSQSITLVLQVESPQASAIDFEQSGELTIESTLHRSLPEDNLDDKARFQGAGSIALNDINNESFSLQADWLYDSFRELPGEHRFDFGSILATLVFQNATLRLGDQELSLANDLISSDTRRGVSLLQRLDQSEDQVEIFSLSTQSLSGVHQGVGIRESETRISGIAAQHHLFNTESSQLVTDLHWLTGKLKQGADYAIDELYENDTISEGQAWSFAFSGDFLEQKLSTRLAFFRSEFDADTHDALNSDSDSKYLINIGYRYQHEDGFMFSSSALQSRTGTFFQSIGNLDDERDRWTRSINSVFQWQSLGIALDFAEYTDNVAGFDNLPTSRARSDNLSVDWSLDDLDSNSLQNIALSLSYNKQSLRHIKLPANFNDTPQRSLQNSLQLGVSIGFINDQITIEIGRSEQSDKFDPDQDVMIHNLTVNYVLGGNDNFSFAPYLSIDNSEQINQSIEQSSRSLGFQVSGLLQDLRLSYSLDAGFNRTEASDSSIGEDNLSINGTVSWEWMEASAARPGLNIGLNVSHNQLKDKLNLIELPSENLVALILTFTFPTFSE